MPQNATHSPWTRAHYQMLNSTLELLTTLLELPDAQPNASLKYKTDKSLTLDKKNLANYIATTRNKVNSSTENSLQSVLVSFQKELLPTFLKTYKKEKYLEDLTEIFTVIEQYTNLATQEPEKELTQSLRDLSARITTACDNIKEKNKNKEDSRGKMIAEKTNLIKKYAAETIVEDHSKAEIHSDSETSDDELPHFPTNPAPESRQIQKNEAPESNDSIVRLIESEEELEKLKKTLAEKVDAIAALQQVNQKWTTYYENNQQWETYAQELQNNLSSLQFDKNQLIELHQQELATLNAQIQALNQRIQKTEENATLIEKLQQKTQAYQTETNKVTGESDKLKKTLAEQNNTIASQQLEKNQLIESHQQELATLNAQIQELNQRIQKTEENAALIEQLQQQNKKNLSAVTLTEKLTAQLAAKEEEIANLTQQLNDTQQETSTLQAAAKKLPEIPVIPADKDIQTLEKEYTLALTKFATATQKMTSTRHKAATQYLSKMRNIQRDKANVLFFAMRFLNALTTAINNSRHNNAKNTELQHAETAFIKQNPKTCASYWRITIGATTMTLSALLSIVAIKLFDAKLLTPQCPSVPNRSGGYLTQIALWLESVTETASAIPSAAARSEFPFSDSRPFLIDLWAKYLSPTTIASTGIVGVLGFFAGNYLYQAGKAQSLVESTVQITTQLLNS